MTKNMSNITKYNKYFAINTSEKIYYKSKKVCQIFQSDTPSKL